VLLLCSHKTRACIRLAPGEPRWYLNRAQYWEGLGNLELADADSKRADNLHFVTTDKLDYYEEGVVAVEQNGSQAVSLSRIETTTTTLLKLVNTKLSKWVNSSTGNI
jgi:hypothetical protein